MQFGVELANTEPWEALREACALADRQRWRTLWTWDHLLPPSAEELPLLFPDREAYERSPLLDGWTLLAGMAMVTSRVRLGCMVSPATFRHPALLARMAVTLDVMSGGRAELGLGAGWHEGEHEAFGLPLGGVRERLDRLDEAAEVVRLLLRGPRPISYEGDFYRLREAPFAPQRPVPMLIAGGGERRTLRCVARFGDACNLYGNLFGSFEDVRRKLGVLDGWCEREGRDPAEVRRTVTLYADLVDDPAEAHRRRRRVGAHLSDEEADALPIGEPARLVDAASAYVDLGVDEVVLNLPHCRRELLERLDADVLASF